MGFHIVGVGPIGSLVAFHMRRCIPPAIPITLVVKTKSRARELRNLGGIVIESNGSPMTQKGFQIEVFDPLEEVVFDMAFDPRGQPQRARTQTKIRDGKGIEVDARSIDSAAQPIKSLIVCTKAHATLNVLRRMKRRITPETTIVLLQNGMGTYDHVVSELFHTPTERPQFILGTTTHAARTKSFGTLFHTIHISSGELCFGIVPDPTGRRDYERSKYDSNTPAHQRALSLNDIASNHRETGIFERYSSLRDTIAALGSLRALSPIWEPISDLQIRLKRKLVVNSIINPLTTLAQCSNGDLLGHDATQFLTKAICNEAEALFAKESILGKDIPIGIMPMAMNDSEYHSESSERTEISQILERGTQENAGSLSESIIPPERMYSIPRGLHSTELQEEVYRIMQKSSMNYSSMFVDILKGRQTEIEYLNGYIRRLGLLYDIPTPQNNSLYNLVKLREKIVPIVRI